MVKVGVGVPRAVGVVLVPFAPTHVVLAFPSTALPFAQAVFVAVVELVRIASPVVETSVPAVSKLL
jgi:hypothetical protein